MFIYHAADDRTPYTYVIGWSQYNKWYYGVRYAKNCHPSDLWNPYKTSSKVVTEFIKENGEPDIINIRKIFNSINSARDWETKVLKRMKVVKSEKWLNKTDNISIDPKCAGHGRGYNKSYKPTKEHLEKLKQINTGKEPWNKGKTGYKIKRTMPNRNKGVKRTTPAWNKGLTKDIDDRVKYNSIKSSETKRKNPKKWTEEQRKNHSIKLTGRKKYKWNEDKKKNSNVNKLNSLSLTCPHCSKEGQYANMRRWHFDNCKTLKEFV